MELTYKQQFIKFMVDNGVLKFGEFTLKSGRKAPYFINTGNYKTGSQLARLGKYYAACIQQNGLKADTLVGPAYKGIPLAVTTAVSLANDYGVDMNYCFDRKEVKGHGEGGQGAPRNAPQIKSGGKRGNRGHDNFGRPHGKGA